MRATQSIFGDHIAQFRDFDLEIGVGFLVVVEISFIGEPLRYHHHRTNLPHLVGTFGAPLRHRPRFAATSVDELHRVNTSDGVTGTNDTSGSFIDGTMGAALRQPL